MVLFILFSTEFTEKNTAVQEKKLFLKSEECFLNFLSDISQIYQLLLLLSNSTKHYVSVMHAGDSVAFKKKNCDHYSHK